MSIKWVALFSCRFWLFSVVTASLFCEYLITSLTSTILVWAHSDEIDVDVSFFSFLKTTYTSHIRVSDQIWLEVERTAGLVRGPDPSLCLVNTSEKRSIWKAWISDNLWPNQEIKRSLWRFNRFFMEYLILKIDT